MNHYLERKSDWCLSLKNLFSVLDLQNQIPLGEVDRNYSRHTAFNFLLPRRFSRDEKLILDFGAK